MAPRLPVAGHVYSVAGGDDRPHHDLCIARPQLLGSGCAPGVFAGIWHGIAQFILGRVEGNEITVAE